LRIEPVVEHFDRTVEGDVLCDDELAHIEEDPDTAPDSSLMSVVRPRPAFVAGQAVRAAALFHLGFENVTHALLKFVADAPLALTKSRPVVVVEFLDNLKGPTAVKRTAHQFGFEPVLPRRGRLRRACHRRCREADPLAPSIGETNTAPRAPVPPIPALRKRRRPLPPSRRRGRWGACLILASLHQTGPFCSSYC
jgi:hypothetical protein